jgi:hypothetical protein
MTSIRQLLAASTTLVLLSACGGGGSSSPAPTPSLMAITSSNQATVARATLDGGLALTQSQGQSATDRATALSLQATSQPSRVGTIDTAIRRGVAAIFSERRSTAAATSGAVARPLVASSTTAACSVAGTVTTTVDDRNNNAQLDGSDTLTLAFAGCKESASDQLDGTMVFTISSVVSATTSNLNFSGSVAFQNLSVVLGQTSASISGSVTLGYVEASGLLQISLGVGSGGLTVSASAPGYSDSVVYDSGMQIATTSTSSTDTLTLNGSFSVGSLGGRVSVSTLQPVTQLSTDLYPHAGQFVVTGAAGSTLRVTVVDTTQVRLELDANADGSYEALTLVSWGSLLG